MGMEGGDGNGMRMRLGINLRIAEAKKTGIKMLIKDTCKGKEKGEVWMATSMRMKLRMK